jgi:hypothetical protein
VTASIFQAFPVILLDSRWEKNKSAEHIRERGERSENQQLEQN